MDIRNLNEVPSFITADGSEIRELLGFRDRGGRNRCRQVEQLLARKVDELEAKVENIKKCGKAICS